MASLDKGCGSTVQVAPGGLCVKNPEADGKYINETRRQHISDTASQRESSRVFNSAGTRNAD